MKYAVVQNQIVKPEPKALRSAFRTLAELVDIDATSLSNDAYGIITDGLNHDQATRLSDALNAQGVSAQVVPDTDFPKLTHAKHVRRVDCSADHMLVYDAIGHTTPVAWNQVVMVAAGLVTVSEFKRVERTRVVVRGGPHGGAYPIFLTDVSQKEESNSRLVLEIYSSTAPVRIDITGKEFQYNYLAERMKPRYTDNFALLVQDVTAFAGTAILNRGAESLRDDDTVTFHYPARHAFEEETVWLLWARSQSQRAGLTVD